MKTLLPAAALAASLSLPLASLAADRTVSLADLDLASNAGHAEAIHRIEKAANDVCRQIPPEGVNPLQDWLDFLDCAKAASKAAAAQLPPIEAGR